MATGIRRRGENWFEINYRPYRGSKAMYRNIRGTLSEAKEARAKMMSDAQETVTPQIQALADRQQTTFSEIWPFIEDYMKGKNLTLNNIVGLRGAYCRIFTDFRDKKYPNVTNPTQLTLPFFLDYERYFNMDLRRPKGVREEVKRVKTIMGKMRKLRFISKEFIDELKDFEIPPFIKKSYPDISRTDFLKLLAYIRQDRPDYYGPIYFMARTGRRIEEVTLIEREKDVHWQGFNPMSIDIRAETTKQKTAAPLNVLDEDLQAHIRFYYTLSNKHHSPYLFLNNQYNKCQQEAVRRYLKKVSKDLIGVKIGCHYFRHRFCTETMKAKMPIIDIQAISGIRDAAMLIRVYCHESADGQASVLEKTKL